MDELPVAAINFDFEPGTEFSLNYFAKAFGKRPVSLYQGPRDPIHRCLRRLQPNIR